MTNEYGWMFLPLRRAEIRANPGLRCAHSNRDGARTLARPEADR